MSWEKGSVKWRLTGAPSSVRNRPWTSALPRKASLSPTTFRSVKRHWAVQETIFPSSPDRLSSRAKLFSPASAYSRRERFSFRSRTSSGSSRGRLYSASLGHSAMQPTPSPTRTKSFLGDTDRASRDRITGCTSTVPSGLPSGRSHLPWKPIQPSRALGREPSSGA